MKAPPFCILVETQHEFVVPKRKPREKPWIHNLVPQGHENLEGDFKGKKRVEELTSTL
jgi:hypothetical protein